MILALLSFGCPRPTTLSVPSVRDAEPDAPATKRTPIVGPRYWTEPGGLCLEVPPGWTGTAGRPPLLLDIEQPTTGFGFQLRAWPATEAVPPREGYDVLFEDGDGFRTVPILGDDTATRTWLSSDASGAMITSWSGPLGDRIVEVAILTPLGRATEGRRAVGEVVRGLCKTWL